MSEDKSGWALVVRFEDQSPSYCHGFEAGKIWKSMEDGLMQIEATVREENLSTLRRMADAMKYTMDSEITSVPGWINVIFAFIGSDPVKKRLTVIPGGLKN